MKGLVKGSEERRLNTRKLEQSTNGGGIIIDHHQPYGRKSETRTRVHTYGPEIPKSHIGAKISLELSLTLMLKITGR